MKDNALCWLLLFSLMPFNAVAKEKKVLEWLTGTLIDASSEQIDQRLALTSYTIDDGDQYIYVLTRIERWNKELMVTVNAPVKFAIVSDRDFLLMDKKGKVHKLSLQKRSLRTPRSHCSFHNPLSSLAIVVSNPRAIT